MGNGPCLCGDPYCASCGDPGLAELEAAEEALMEKLSELSFSSSEYYLLISLAPGLVEAHRTIMKERIDELGADHAQAVAYWKERAESKG